MKRITSHINWPILRAKLREAILILPHFLKNPVQGMRTLPSWDWPTILVLQGALALICSVLGNLIERDLFGLFTGLVLAPLASYLIQAIFAGFFYYTFLFFFKREIPYRQIYQQLLFAGIPFMVVNIVASLVPAILIVGVGAGLLLLFVGFTDGFQLERRKVRNILGGIMAIYCALWIIQVVQTSHKQERRRVKVTPDSMDILEKELNMGN